MKDYDFPILSFQSTQTPRQRGRQHGESFREGIAELAEIRRELLFKKNPALRAPILEDLALAQWQATEAMSPRLLEELDGIREGSGLSLTSIVILNNYTDFRDIELTDQGCTTVCVKNKNGIVAGQTWDMHASAKRFLSVLEIPKSKDEPAQIVLSLLGCVGLMGLTDQGVFVGVNNINTSRARVGVIWPALVRHALFSDTAEAARDVICKAAVTSGHNYLIADSKSGGFNVEKTPDVCETVNDNTGMDSGVIFHTNHCLGPEVSKLEVKGSLSSTTFDRWKIFEGKAPAIETSEDLVKALKSHDGYPKSICSHYQTGDVDPSTTCGGGVADLTNHKLHLWRGCREYDSNYHAYSFTWKPGEFVRI